MVPCWPARRPGSRAAPRTRGVSPAYAGKLRSRGICSPHPRGWSPHPNHRERLRQLLPAPAGLVPRGLGDIEQRHAGPGTRGVGPR
ncbi:hypothetical protein CP981_06460 [Streptomyces platensis]|uniref:Uncharacterized protein n=1 Tax=Streptomyces platensis TaxID=58346 RepID=A0AAE6NGF2_STRPT|nr:hypothetical protein CP981_06460 [Streptomyces platensis]